MRKLSAFGGPYAAAYPPHFGQFAGNLSFIKQISMRKLGLVMLALLAVLSQLLAQNRVVTGRVVDNQGNPVPNASVTVKGARAGTSANAQGVFTLSVPNDARTLVISSAGFETVEVSTDRASSITLMASTGAMNEVVVTALGITKERRQLGYATQTVKNDALVDKGETSLLNALQGKIAGADIVGAGGAAGASTTILLRGISSFNGNQSPLFVIDGIPISDATDESTVGLYTNQSSNRTADLNMNNIESVNVLAGPAAAALYGSRAAHGAIMITTKKGSGKKGVVDVTYNTSYTTQKVYGFPELQNKFGQGGSGVFSAISGNSYGPAFGSTPTIVNGLIVPTTATGPQYVNGVYYAIGQTIPYQAFPDNIMTYFRRGNVTENNLTINSGDARNNYGVSLGRSKQEGILPNSAFTKTNAGVNFGAYLTDKLNVRASATYFNTKQEGPTQGSNGTYSAYANVYRMPRSLDFEYYKNNYTNPRGYNNWYVPNVYSTAIQDTVSNGDNPYFAAYKNPITSNLSRIVGSMTIGYDIRPWLNASYRAGVDAYTDRRHRTVALGSAQVVRSAFTGSPGTATGGIMEDVFYRNELNGDFMLNARKNDIFMKGLNATVLLGQGVTQQMYQQVNQTGYGLSVPGYYNITNATNLTLTNEYHSLKRLWGIYGQVTLGYNNYAFLELTGRRDVTSTLPTNNNAYFYPSAAFSFIITDALHIKSKALSFAKARIAYAKVGKDAPVYSLDNTYSSASVGNNVANFSFPFGSVAGFTANSTLGNKALTPEFISTLDLGVNLGFFDNRLNIDATVYNSKSTDMIVPVGLPASSGYLNRYVNVGEMTNKGLEITVQGTPVKTRNFTWSVSGNFSFNRNKVTKLAEGLTSYSFGGTAFSGLIPTVAINEPYGVIRGGKWVTNANGDRLIDSTTGGYLNYLTDQTVLDPNRKFITGLTNSFTFKNFTLSALVDYKHGGQFESFTVATLRANGSLAVTEDRENPFVLPGVIDLGNGKYRPNNIQISGQTFYNASLGGATGSTTANEFAIFDASTFRVREVSLSYNLTSLVNRTKFIKGARITFYGRNLYFYAPNSPIDPELSTQGGGAYGGAGSSSSVVRGLELGSAPSTRNLGASLRLNF